MGVAMFFDRLVNELSSIQSDIFSTSNYITNEMQSLRYFSYLLCNNQFHKCILSYILDLVKLTELVFLCIIQLLLGIYAP